MCIHLYGKPICCSSFQDIYAQLEDGGGVSLPWVYVHSSICETYLVYWSSRDLCVIGGGGGGSVCHGYMCILLYVKLIQCSRFPKTYAQLEEGVRVSLPWVYVHSSICETYSV